MSRLTKDIRERMARKLVAYRYTDEAKELSTTTRKLFEEAHRSIYTPEITAHMEAVEKVFPKTFARDNRITVNAGGFRFTLGDRLSSRWIHTPVAVEKPDDLRIMAYQRYDTHNLTDDKLIEKVKTFAIRWKGFDDVCQTAYNEALSVLNTITTGKKLAEAWPEAIPVIGDLIPEGDRTLPVVQVSAINAKFKLPPETKAA